MGPEQYIRQSADPEHRPPALLMYDLDQDRLTDPVNGEYAGDHIQATADGYREFRDATRLLRDSYRSIVTHEEERNEAGEIILDNEGNSNLVPVSSIDTEHQETYELIVNAAYAQNAWIDAQASRERKTFTIFRDRHSQVEAARNNYETARRELKSHVFNRILERNNLDDDQLRLASIRDDASGSLATRDGKISESKELAGIGIYTHGSRDIVGGHGLWQRIKAGALDKWSSWGGGRVFNRVETQYQSGDQILTRHETHIDRRALRGRRNKFIAMGAVGTAAALPAAALAAPVVGTGMALVAGAGAASGIARGLAGATMNRHAQNRNQTKINAQANRQHDEQIETIFRAHENHNLSGMAISESYRDGTEREVGRNRRRTGIATGVTGAFGLGTAVGMGWLKNVVPNLWHDVDLNPFDGPGDGSGSQAGSAPETPSDVPSGEQPTPDASSPESTSPPTPEVDDYPPRDELTPMKPDTDVQTGPENPVEESFWTNNGHGISHELVEYANKNGIELCGDDAFLIYEELERLMAEGKIDGIIDVEKVARDLYMMDDGNWGISAPGKSSWEESAQPHINRLIEEYTGQVIEDYEPEVDVSVDASDATDVRINDAEDITTKPAGTPPEADTVTSPEVETPDLDYDTFEAEAGDRVVDVIDQTIEHEYGVDTHPDVAENIYEEVHNRYEDGSIEGLVNVEDTGSYDDVYMNTDHEYAIRSDGTAELHPDVEAEVHREMMERLRLDEEEFGLAA